jgi:hypothetical protein
MLIDKEALMHQVMTSGRNKKLYCPCCGRLVHVYPRGLNSGMARFLLLLVRAYKKYPRFYSTRDLMPHDNKACSDGTYLVHWGLIEKSDGTNSAMAPAGSYRPTEKGLRFAHGLERVPSHAHVIPPNTLVGWSDKTTDVKKALGKKFNYEELMR